MNCVIGMDFGTQSARAVLVSADNGEVLCSHTVKYPHGVIGDGLALAEDYKFACIELLSNVIPSQYRSSVVGICIDATSLTLVPVAADGKVLSELPELSGREHAQIKLWKRHSAQKYADEALNLARQHWERFLSRTGGGLSCEWTLPKLMEIRDEDAHAYQYLDTALDLCEFLTYQLTGKLVRSIGSISYKGLWACDLGFPTDYYLNSLRPGLAEKYRHVMRGEIKRAGEMAGYLKPEICRKLGLRSQVAVATGVLDGHTALVAMGAFNSGDAALVIGTSNVLTVQTEHLYEAEGICGIARDGLTPGLFGVDAGQSCTGDMLEWFIQNSLPNEYFREAEVREISVHQLLECKITCPWQNSLIVADWWNGSRNAPCNLNLRGMIAGLSLDTRPEDIYLALLQSIVCGTGEIIDRCVEQGIAVRRILATGGIANKNRLLMQEYANLLNRPIDVGAIGEGPAVGSAILAAVAAGLYPSVLEAYNNMGVKGFVRYQPDGRHRAEYELLYQKNHTIRELSARYSSFL